MLEYTTVKQTNKSYEKLFSEEELSVLLKLSEHTPDLSPSFCVLLPCFENAEIISQFYTSMCKNCIKSFLHGLAKPASGEKAEKITTATSENAENEASAGNTRRSTKTGYDTSIGRHRKKSGHTDGIQLFSSFTIAKNSGDLLSLYTDISVTHGQTPIFYKRTSQTWLVPEQRLLDIRAACRVSGFTFSNADIKKSDTCDRTSEDKHKHSFRHILKRTKIPRTDDFYLTEEGITLFYDRFAPTGGRVRRSQFASLFVETVDFSR